MRQTGDISHFISRLQVRREVPPISFVDDDLSVLTHRNQKAFSESQIGIEIKLNSVEKKRIRYKIQYLNNRESHIKKVCERRKKNREAYNFKRRETYQKRKEDPVEREKIRVKLSNQRNAKPDVYSAIAKRHRDKKFAKMTPEQAKEYRRHYNQQYKQRMIEKLGVEEWRKFNNDRKKSYKAKKNENSKS